MGEPFAVAVYETTAEQESELVFWVIAKGQLVKLGAVHEEITVNLKKYNVDSEFVPVI